MVDCRVYLLKRRIPVDYHSGFDMRFIELCPFLDGVFYLEERHDSTCGENLDDEPPRWPATKLDSFQALEQHLAGREQDAWIAADYESFLALKSFGIATIVYDNCDSRSLYYWRRFRMLPWQRWQSKLNSLMQCFRWGCREHRILKDSRLVIVPAERDQRAYRFWGRGRVEVVTNGTAWVREPPISRGKNLKTCCFHGVFSWEVNVSTAEFLVKKLHPCLQERIDGVELKIAGHPVPDAVKKFSNDPSVHLEGFVEDIREWLSGCGVYVMPMFQGGGVKNKLLEGMAAGLPIVTNSLGAEAMPEASRDGFVVADGLEGIAAAVQELLENPDMAEQLAKTARAYAEKHFGWEPLRERYCELIKGAVKT